MTNTRSNIVLYDSEKCRKTYISMPQDVSIKNENQIIYAPNGTGKSSIVDDIKNNTTEKVAIYEYNQDAELAIVEDNFVINTRTKELTDLQINCKKYSNEVNPSHPLKNIFVDSTQKGLIKNGVDKIYHLLTKNNYECTDNKPLSEVQRKVLQPFINSPKDLGILLESEKDLILIDSEVKLSKELEQMKCADLFRLFESGYDIEKHKDDIDKEGCPFCGRKAMNDENLYKIISERKNKILEQEKSYFSKFDCLKEDSKKPDFEKEISNIIKVFKSLSDEQKRTLVFTGGKKEKEKNRGETLQQLNDSNKKYSECKKRQDGLYKLMKESMDYIQQVLPSYYPGSQIVADDTAKTIRVSLPRKGNTYSDGEQHRLYEIIKLLGFAGSDNDILLVDDPLTELDFANQYRVIFDFVDLINERNDKRIVIFTCDAEMINISHSQNPKAFSYYYMQSFLNDNKLRINLLEMKFKHVDCTQPYLDIKELYESDAERLPDKLVELLCKRNELEIKKSVKDSYKKEELASLDKLLHYDQAFEYKGISNDLLADFAGNRNHTIESKDFKKCICNKIAVLAAERVWVEKKMYEFSSYVMMKYNENVFEKPQQTLAMKIKTMDNYLKKSKHVDVKNIYPSWNRKALMSKKVMINDICHPLSQFAPFSYAMSVPDQVLKNEMDEIKNIFGRNEYDKKS